MRIICTGSEGYLGHHIVNRLIEAFPKCEIIGIDNYSSYGRIKREHTNSPNFKLKEWDLERRDIAEYLYPTITSFRPHILIHTASFVGGISTFSGKPYDTFIKNEKISLNVIDTLVQYNHRNSTQCKLINISTGMLLDAVHTCNLSESYYKVGYKATENDIYHIPPSLSTYAMNKLSTERMIEAASRQYGLEYTTLRPGNLVGSNRGETDKSRHHLWPDLIKKSLDKLNPLPIYGDGSQIRDYVKVSDVAKVVELCCMSKWVESYNQTFNVSSNYCKSVKFMAETIWSKINPQEPLQLQYLPAFAEDVAIRRNSNLKLIDILGFTPDDNMDSVIDEMIEDEIFRRKLQNVA